MKDYGVQLAVDMIKRLLECKDVSGIHISTLNLERSAKLILRNLGLAPQEALVTGKSSVGLV